MDEPSRALAADGRPIALYVHVPFCEAKCAYCHFAIDPRRPDEDREERYTRAVLAQMAAAEPGAADTLYFGGGTPSLLSASRLARIVALARSRFALAPGAEVTLEANPRDLDLDGFRALRAVGVNRLSLGVQSLDAGVLREIGRLHGPEDGLRSVSLAREAAFANLSVDLILGWPGETFERWGRTVEGVLAASPDHVSLYVLEVEGKTALAHRQRQRVLELPEDDLVAELYAWTVDRLAAAGLERYEISNFARRGFESRHNTRYWDDAPFLGFGMSAHSYRHGRRWWNRETYAAYCRAVEEGGGAAAVAGERVLTAREHLGEAAFTALRRREGIDLAAFRIRYRADVLEEFGSGLRDAFEAGLVEQAGDRLRLTEKGILLSNEVFRAFV